MDSALQQKIQSFYAANQAAVDALGAYIGVPGLWFCCLFDNESSLNPQAVNPVTGAAGLNQMMPATLAGLGITPDQYLNGGVAYQCQVMQSYFAPVAGKIKRAGDLYLYDFWPLAIKDDYSATEPIGIQGGDGSIGGILQATIYSENKSLDYNGDGIINRQDFWDGFETKYSDVLATATPALGYAANDLWIDLKANWIVWAVVLVMIIAVLVLVYKEKL